MKIKCNINGTDYLIERDGEDDFFWTSKESEGINYNSLVEAQQGAINYEEYKLSENELV